MNITKKSFLFLSLALSLMASDKMQIFKPITATCPQSWLDEVKNEVGETEIVTLQDVKGLKFQAGIPLEMQSCNTSVKDDYVFEGNVPPLAIKKFLKEKPKNAIGLSLPVKENDKNPKTVYILFEDKTYKEYGKY